MCITLTEMMQIKVLQMKISAVSIRSIMNSGGCTFEAHNQIGNANFIRFLENLENSQFPSICENPWKFIMKKFIFETKI